MLIFHATLFRSVLLKRCTQVHLHFTQHFKAKAGRLVNPGGRAMRLFLCAFGLWVPVSIREAEMAGSNGDEGLKGQCFYTPQSHHHWPQSSMTRGEWSSPVLSCLEGHQMMKKVQSNLV